MGIAERLQEERKRLGLTQEVLAKQISSTKRSVINWEGGTASPSGEVLSRYAQAGADVLYVLTGSRVKNEVTLGQYAKPGPHTHAIPDPGPKSYGNADEYVYVAKYDLHASAGNGAVIHDESVVDHLAFKRNWITRTLGLDPKSLALIDVAGDSMSPTINDGDLILLDTRPEHVRAEGIYVINLAGALLVKRLRMRLSGVVDVVSDNERYGTETISGEQLASLQIVGRVVWQGRRV